MSDIAIRALAQKRDSAAKRITSGRNNIKELEEQLKQAHEGVREDLEEYEALCKAIKVLGEGS